jgi:hypothetical protein
MLQEVRRDARGGATPPPWARGSVSKFAPTRLDPNSSPAVDPRVATREQRQPTAPRPRAGRSLSALVVLFAFLNAADLITTFIGLHGGLHEGNPLMGALLTKYGFIALVVYKVLVVAAVALGVRMLRSFRASVASVTIVICDLLVLLVVFANVAQYFLR